MGDEHLQALHVGSLVDDQLQEEFIDGLQVGPFRIDDDLLIFNSILSGASLLLQDGQRPEDVLLDHFHD